MLARLSDMVNVQEGRSHRSNKLDDNKQHFISHVLAFLSTRISSNDSSSRRSEVFLWIPNHDGEYPFQDLLVPIDTLLRTPLSANICLTRLRPSPVSSVKLIWQYVGSQIALRHSSTSVLLLRRPRPLPFSL